MTAYDLDVADSVEGKQEAPADAAIDETAVAVACILAAAIALPVGALVAAFLSVGTN